MRTLIYKRTHSGDPDPETGVFGNNDCEGSVRDWDYGAVIGVGGISAEPRRHGIAGKLTWVGIGPQKLFDSSDTRGPRVTFRHFLYFGEYGPLLTKSIRRWRGICTRRTEGTQCTHRPPQEGPPSTATSKPFFALPWLRRLLVDQLNRTSEKSAIGAVRDQSGALRPRHRPFKSRDCAGD